MTRARILSVNASAYDITAAETAASVTPANFAYPPFDIRRYGADPTGATPSDTALAAAISVCGATGGTILIPAGLYIFGNTYSLSQKQSIVFQGSGTTTNASQGTSTIRYTGTISPWFSAPLANGISFRNLIIQHTNAGFTGTYIKFGAIASSPGSYSSVVDCTIGCSVSNTTHLDLDQTINFTAQRCLFAFGNPSVKGQAVAGGSFSNVISFRECSWVASGTNGSVANGGQAWVFDTCDFEALANGNAVAFGTTSSAPCQDITFTNCWIGDAGSGKPGTWITFFGQGLNVEGCFIAGTSASESISLNNCQGVRIVGNYFLGASSAIGFDTVTIGGVVIQDNYFKACTNVFGLPQNAPLNLVFNPNTIDGSSGIPIPPPSSVGKYAANGFSVDENGIIEQWGNATVTTGTPLAITFNTNGINFPTALWAVNATLSGPSGAGNTVYVSSPSTTGFTLNVNGTAGSNPVYWRARGN